VYYKSKKKKNIFFLLANAKKKTLFKFVGKQYRKLLMNSSLYKIKKNVKLLFKNKAVKLNNFSKLFNLKFLK
jgi:hypothetical protein